MPIDKLTPDELAQLDPMVRAGEEAAKQWADTKARMRTIPAVRTGENMLLILEQDTWWWPQGSDAAVRLVDMDVRHRRNLLRWFRRHAKTIAGNAGWGMLTLWGPAPNGEMAADAYEAAMDQEWDEQFDHPWRWLRRQDLIVALRRLVIEDMRRARTERIRRADPVTVLGVDF